MSPINWVQLDKIIFHFPTLSRSICYVKFNKFISFSDTLFHANFIVPLSIAFPLPIILSLFFTIASIGLHCMWTNYLSLFSLNSSLVLPHHFTNAFTSDYISPSLSTHPPSHAHFSYLDLLMCCLLVAQDSILYSITALQMFY